MAKPLFIAEKPSVAAEFAKALKMNGKRRDGYVESENGVVTWCVGHLVTMSYPEVYDERLKRWSLETLPFIPEQFLYEVIPSVKKQFEIVKGLLNREDIDCIYVCTDSGREGEYIYRLVEQMAGVHGKQRKRVWIDSQTEEEILRGVREAKDLSEYDHLSEAAYLRAKEDYLMGINFSRLLTLKYGRNISGYLPVRIYSLVQKYSYSEWTSDRTDRKFPDGFRHRHRPDLPGQSQIQPAGPEYRHHGESDHRNAAEMKNTLQYMASCPQPQDLRQT